MKATILFKDSTYSFKKIKHGIIDLTAVLNKNFSYALSEYNDLLRRLELHYNYRYPDNSDKSSSRSSGEIVEIDRLYFFLLDKLNIPDFLKYRNIIFEYLFSENSFDLKIKSYLLNRNYVLNQRIDEYRAKYEKTIPRPPIRWFNT